MHALAKRIHESCRTWGALHGWLKFAGNTCAKNYFSAAWDIEQVFGYKLGALNCWAHQLRHRQDRTAHNLWYRLSTPRFSRFGSPAQAFSYKRLAQRVFSDGSRDPPRDFSKRPCKVAKKEKGYIIITSEPWTKPNDDSRLHWGAQNTSRSCRLHWFWHAEILQTSRQTLGAISHYGVHLASTQNRQTFLNEPNKTFSFYRPNLQRIPSRSWVPQWHARYGCSSDELPLPYPRKRCELRPLERTWFPCCVHVGNLPRLRSRRIYKRFSCEPNFRPRYPFQWSIGLRELPCGRIVRYTEQNWV